MLSPRSHGDCRNESDFQIKNILQVFASQLLLQLKKIRYLEYPPESCG